MANLYRGRNQIMSFRISIPPNRRAALRLLSSVRQQLLAALASETDASGRTQADIARELGVNRSVISRFLSGSRDMMVGNLAEVAWALDREVAITLGEAGSGIKSRDIAAEAVPATVMVNASEEAEKYGAEVYRMETSVSGLTVQLAMSPTPASQSSPTGNPVFLAGE